MVVRFDMGEVQLREIVAAPQSLVLSFCGEDTYRGGTIHFLFGDG